MNPVVKPVRFLAHGAPTTDPRVKNARRVSKSGWSSETDTINAAVSGARHATKITARRSELLQPQLQLVLLLPGAARAPD